MDELQCFIVYDDLTKKVAISLRNRLSEKDVKCTIWDEKQFRDNEARLSNFNRLLILSEKVFAEYLAAPTNVKQALTDYSYYVREGRVASITLRDDIDYETANEIMTNIMTALTSRFKKKKKNEDISAEDVERELDQLLASLASLMPKEDIQQTKETISKTDKKKKDISKVMVGFMGVRHVIPSLVALYGYSWCKSRKNMKDMKLAFYFAAARQFELHYFDDFVNAK